MRTLEELLNLINPVVKDKRKMLSKWIYIAVEANVEYPEKMKEKMRGRLSEDDKWIVVHELHFGPNGDFIGITEKAINFGSESLEELTQTLDRVKKDINNFPTLTWEEHQLIHNQ